MGLASQQFTPTTGSEFTAALYNSEMSEIYGNLNDITDAQINASAALAWSKLESASWTNQTGTTWYTQNGGESIGNGSITSYYIQLGKVVFWQFYISFGSTTNFGSGEFRFTTPVTAATNATQQAGAARLYDTNTTTSRAGAAIIGNAGFAAVTFDGATAAVSSTNPWTWATGDLITFGITYEAA